MQSTLPILLHGTRLSHTTRPTHLPVFSCQVTAIASGDIHPQAWEQAAIFTQVVSVGSPLELSACPRLLQLSRTLPMVRVVVKRVSYLQTASRSACCIGLAQYNLFQRQILTWIMKEYICEPPNCCSVDGFCGNNTHFCGSGCQPAFGVCHTGPATPKKVARWV